MLPLALGLLPVRDAVLTFSNQFFVLSTMIVMFVSQRHRFGLEWREHLARRETERLLAEVSAHATTDSLTDLSNRRHLMEAGEREIARARRHGRPLAVVMLDVDGFKRINDGHGHGTGDEVLRYLARRVRADRRQEDTAARYGGDEIVLLLPESDEGAALAVAERIRTALTSEPLATPGGPLAVTASFGVAVLEDGVSDLAALLARADEALYAAKRRGRNCSVLWSREAGG
jgi:diguanylate cyclase (GGDEF)-like protein